MIENHPVWHYTLHDRQYGPVVAAEIKRLINVGRIPANALIWKSGMQKWQPAYELPDFTPQAGNENVDLTSVIWYYSADDKSYGPFSAREVRRFIRNGAISPENKVWNRGMEKWTEAKVLPEFVGVESKKIQLTNPPMAPHQEHARKLGKRAVTHRGDLNFLHRFVNFLSLEGILALGLGVYVGALWLTQSPSRFTQTLWAFLVLAVIAGGAALCRSCVKHWGWLVATLLFPIGTIAYAVADFRNAWRVLVLAFFCVFGSVYYIANTDFSESPHSPALDQLQQDVRALFFSPAG